MGPLAVLLLAFILSCSFLFLRTRNQHKQYRFPPQPKAALPIIGHMYLLGHHHPHRRLHELAKQYGGLMYLKLGSTHTLVASSADAAKHLLKTHDIVFASRPDIAAKRYFGYNGQDLGWAPYGEHWRNLKKLVTLEIFSAKRLEMFKPLRRLEISVLVKDLLHACKKEGPVNVSEMIADVMFNIVSRIVMNKSYSEAATSQEEKDRALEFKIVYAESLMLMGTRPYIGDFIPALSWMDTHVPRVKKVQAGLDAYLQRQLDEHKQTWKEGEVPKDFMDVMLSTGTMSDISIKGLTMDLIGAGTDTASTGAEWALAELLKQPKLLRKVRDELDQVIGSERTMTEDDIPQLKYLTAVVKETLRLHPPAPMALPHESLEDCQIGDYLLPAKTRAIINIFAIGRDPKYWSEPDKFDPERFLGEKEAMDIRGKCFEMIPFGSGRRMCPGNALGYAMVHYILGTLVHAFDWDGYKPEELDMEEAYGLGLPRANPLMLKPSARLSTQAYEEA